MIALVKLGGFLCLLGSLSGDLREQKINVIPIVIWTVLGICIRIVTGRFLINEILVDTVPAIGCLLISKACKDCIGKGDVLLILCIGVWSGLSFCLRFLFITMISIFFYAVFMLMKGKIKRNTSVACVPFMIIGYIGAWLV